MGMDVIEINSIFISNINVFILDEKWFKWLRNLWASTSISFVFIPFFYQAKDDDLSPYGSLSYSMIDKKNM